MLILFVKIKLVSKHFNKIINKLVIVITLMIKLNVIKRINHIFSFCN